MNLGDFYFNRIKAKFYEMARDMIFDPIAIVKSEAEADAGLIGAAAPAPRIVKRKGFIPKHIEFVLGQSPEVIKMPVSPA